MRYMEIKYSLESSRPIRKLYELSRELFTNQKASWTLRKVFNQLESFINSLESYWPIRKLSMQLSGELSTNQKAFCATLWRVLDQLESFIKSPESSQPIRKLYKLSGEFSTNQKALWTFRRVITFCEKAFIEWLIMCMFIEKSYMTVQF